MKLTIAQAQIRPTKRDYDHNLGVIGDVCAQLAGEPPDVLCLPETCLSGYFLEGGVIEAARPAEQVFEDVQRVFVERTGGQRPMHITLGFYERANGNLYNSMLYAALGPEPRLLHVHRKFFLPTYGVFDEKRFVSRGRTFATFDAGPCRAGMLVCEDLWHSVSATLLALKGALIVYVGAASPARGFGGEEIGNIAHWRRLLAATADEHGIFIVFTSLVGFEGGRGLVGNSALVGPTGEFLNEAPAAKDYLLRTTIDLEDITVVRARSPMAADLRAAMGDLAPEFSRIAQQAEDGAHAPGDRGELPSKMSECEARKPGTDTGRAAD